MELARSKKGSVASQHKYVIESLFDIVRQVVSQPRHTHVASNEELGDIEGDSIKVGRCQRFAGKLLYSSHKRTNIAFTVCSIDQLCTLLRKLI